MRRFRIPAFGRALSLGLAVIAAWALGAAPAYPDDALLRRSVVQVEVSPVIVDPLRPWIREPGQKFVLTGVVVEGRRILTTAGDLRHAGFLEVRKFSSYKKVSAGVARLDLESNLALLTVEDSAFFEDLSPLSWGREPAPGESLQAARFDELFRVHRERAGIQGVEAVSDYGVTHLPIVRLSVTSSFRAGGLLLRGGGLAGFISYGESETRAEAIPAPLVRTFVEQRAAGPAFPAAGFAVAALVDPVLREHYGLDARTTGVLVTRVLPGTSAFGSLRKDDVLVSIDGIPLDSRGFYDDAQWGRQSGLLLFARRPDGQLRQPGGALSLSVIRERKTLQLQLRLQPYAGGAERIPWMGDPSPAYLMEGGFVFLELSVPLLRRRFGDGWRAAAGEVSHLFERKRYRASPDTDRLIVLSEVLPDPTNRGYDKLSFVVVEKVDGRPMANLGAFHAYLKQRVAGGAPYARLTVAGGLPIYVGLRERPAVQKRILERYGLPRAHTFGD